MADDPVEKAVAFTLDNWDSLGVAEQDGVLYMPASIKRRSASGGVTEQAVMLRNVTNAHKFKCRSLARKYAEQAGLDLDRDRDLVVEIENYALLAFAVRDARKPFDQHVPDVVKLLELYDAQSLAELWGRYNAWIEMLDPRFGELTVEQLWQTIVRIAKEKNPSPLVAMPGHAQFTCIVLMAQQALLSQSRPSWVQPPSTSRLVS
jgi:hypothetical protein